MHHKVNQLYTVMIYNPIWYYPEEDVFPFESSEGFFLMSSLCHSELLIRNVNLYPDFYEAVKRLHTAYKRCIQLKLN